MNVDQPVLLLDVSASLKSNQLTVSGLQELLPDSFVCLSSTDNDGAPLSVSVGAFANYMQAQDCGPGSDDEPLCIFDSELIDSDEGAPLRELYSPPDVAALDLRLGLLESLACELRPPVHYLLMGPARSGTCMHQVNTTGERDRPMTA